MAVYTTTTLRITRWMLVQWWIGVRVTSLFLWTQKQGLRVLAILLAGCLALSVRQVPRGATPVAAASERVVYVPAPALHAIPRIASIGLRGPLPQVGLHATDVATTINIRNAWAAFGEPYQNEATMLVELSRQFHIDPTIPAALFMHEDGNINNRAAFPSHMNNLLFHDRNPGNIKCFAAGRGCYGGFQVFPTYRAGVLAWFDLYDYYIATYKTRSLAQFISIYCPSAVDGNGPTAMYTGDVLVKSTQIKSGW